MISITWLRFAPFDRLARLTAVWIRHFVEAPYVRHALTEQH